MPTEKRTRLSPLHHLTDICDRNAAQGWIPERQPFASGHQAPLFHPQCKCSLEVQDEPEPTPESIPRF